MLSTCHTDNTMLQPLWLYSFRWFHASAVQLPHRFFDLSICQDWAPLPPGKGAGVSGASGRRGSGTGGPNGRISWPRRQIQTEGFRRFRMNRFKAQSVSTDTKRKRESKEKRSKASCSHINQRIHEELKGLCCVLLHLTASPQKWFIQNLLSNEWQNPGFTKKPRFCRPPQLPLLVQSLMVATRARTPTRQAFGMFIPISFTCEDALWHGSSARLFEQESEGNKDSFHKLIGVKVRKCALNGRFSTEYAWYSNYSMPSSPPQNIQVNGPITA